MCDAVSACEIGVFLPFTDVSRNLCIQYSTVQSIARGRTYTSPVGGEGFVLFVVCASFTARDGSGNIRLEVHKGRSGETMEQITGVTQGRRRGEGRRAGGGGQGSRIDAWRQRTYTYLLMCHLHISYPTVITRSPSCHYILLANWSPT